MHNPNQLLYITIQKNYWDDYHQAVENQNNKILTEIKTLTTKLISKITNKPNLYNYVLENIFERLSGK